MFVSRKFNKFLTLFGLFAVGLVSFVFCLQASSNSESTDHIRAAFFGTHLRAWEFLVGAMAFCLFKHFGPMRSRLIALMIAFLGLLMMLYGVFFISSTAGYPSIHTAVPVVGTALLIYGGSAPIGFSFLFSNPLFVWLGNVSYGWYLWHWPIVVFVQRALSAKAIVLVLASLFALFFATLTNRFFENPIRYSSKLAGKKSWAVLVACMLVSLLAVGSVNKLAATGLGLGVESSGSELIALENCRGRAAVEFRIRTLWLFCWAILKPNLRLMVFSRLVSNLEFVSLDSKLTDAQCQRDLLLRNLSGVQTSKMRTLIPLCDLTPMLWSS
jgi:hypothetical protein